MTNEARMLPAKTYFTKVNDKIAGLIRETIRKIGHGGSVRVGLDIGCSILDAGSQRA
jgi:hypothetical protein